MKTIPEKYCANGWHYKLVTRTNDGAIYSQSKHPDLPAIGKASAFEVARIRTRPGRRVTLGTATFDRPAGEYLPKTEEWGTYGWTFPTFEGARVKLAEISRKTGTRMAEELAFA